MNREQMIAWLTLEGWDFVKCVPPDQSRIDVQWYVIRDHQYILRWGNGRDQERYRVIQDIQYTADEMRKIATVCDDYPDEALEHFYKVATDGYARV